jgi:hypothetical protein
MHYLPMVPSGEEKARPAKVLANPLTALGFSLASLACGKFLGHFKNLLVRLMARRVNFHCYGEVS